jgi:hypothetical protein
MVVEWAAHGLDLVDAEVGATVPAATPSSPVTMTAVMALPDRGIPRGGFAQVDDWAAGSGSRGERRRAHDEL